MKIDALYWKIFGGVFLVNLIFWILSATTLDFNNGASATLPFAIYIAPVILPLAPWIDHYDSASWFVPLTGAAVLVVLPLFWSAVAYGVVRLIRKLRKRSA